MLVATARRASRQQPAGFQSNATRVGCNPITTHISALMLYFNLTQPVLVATVHALKLANLMLFQSNATRVGCNDALWCFNVVKCVFQSNATRVGCNHTQRAIRRRY